LGAEGITLTCWRHMEHRTSWWRAWGREYRAVLFQKPGKETWLKYLEQRNV